MSVELWVEGSCVCGKRAAWPEGGYIPVCGACGWPFAPPTANERRERGRALLVLAAGSEAALGKATSWIAKGTGHFDAPVPGAPSAEDVQRWALAKGWDPETRRWTGATEEEFLRDEAAQ